MTHSRYLAIALAAGLALAACDGGNPDDGNDDPPDPPRLAPLVEYRMSGYGNFPTDHADIVWYTDAVGDTVKVGFNTLPWSNSFRLDTLNHSREAGLYLCGLVNAPYNAVGLRLTIHVDGVFAAEAYRDGSDSPAVATNRLIAEEGLPFE